ncbi:MAG TPA: hypothetical protein VJ418_01110, partial [Streptosporangiaceae bacterium]|nr:hypothetical protein [Streptosporangiaceae bacterium]
MGTSQPAQGIDAPAGADRTGPGIGLAKRGRIGIPRDARTHFAPHDRHPQLIADYSPPGFPGAGVCPGVGAGPGPGFSLSIGAGLGADIGLSEGFLAGMVGVVRSGVAIAGRLVTAIVAELGKPV